MGTMIDAVPKFHEEAKVWNYFKENLSDEIVVYNGREIKGKEFDFCLLVPGKGLIIVEVKGWKPERVTAHANNRITISGMLEDQLSPKNQARGYRFNLIDKLSNTLHLNPFVTDFACFPLLSEDDFVQTGLSRIMEREGVLLRPDLEDPVRLSAKINAALDHPSLNTTLMDRQVTDSIRSFFEPDYHPAAEEESRKMESEPAVYSILQVIRENAHESLIEELIHQYEQGTKLILFFSDPEPMQQLRMHLAAWQSKASLLLEGSTVQFSAKQKTPSWIEPSAHLKLFNIEAFLLPSHADAIPEIRIENGKAQADQQAVLEQIADVVPFNLVQYQIEHQPSDASIMIRAGAGTGKTYSMVSRVGFLTIGPDACLKNLATDLAMMTFTNEAADTMRNRLTELFMNYYRITRQPAYLHRIQELMDARITTIHRFCLSLLRANSLESGLGVDFSISSDPNLRNQIYRKYFDEYMSQLPEGKQMDFWRSSIPNYSIIKVLKELADRIFNKNIPLDQISKKTIGTGVTETIADFPDLILKVLVPAETEYGKTLKEQDRLELNRMITAANAVLRAGHRLEGLDLKVLFVDEFQDTDNSQIELIELIDQNCRQNLPLFVVGDLKQSIYRFRGATMSAFEKLKEIDRSWSEFSLQLNYRSDTALLDEMDQLFLRMAAMKRLPYRSEDRLIGVKNSGEKMPILFVRCDDRDIEEKMNTLMKTVREQIAETSDLLTNKHLSKAEKTIAILVRTNAEAEMVMEAGRKAGISIESEQNGSLYQSQAAGDLLKLVRALTTSTDPAVIADLLCSDYFGHPINMNGISGFNSEERLQILSEVLDENLKDRTKQTWAELQASVYSEPILSILHRAYSDLKPWRNFSSDQYLQKQYRFEFDQVIEDMQNHWRADAISISDAQSYLERSIIASRQVNLRELSRNDEKNVPVVCMTIHKSKGLEFGTVILPFLDRELEQEMSFQVEVDLNRSGFGYFIHTQEYQNTITQRNTPFDTAVDDEEKRSEEVRILYVAMTRTIRKLVWLSDPDKRAKLSLSDYMKEPDYD